MWRPNMEWYIPVEFRELRKTKFNQVANKENTPDHYES
jgi:hypothetical protein